MNPSRSIYRFFFKNLPSWWYCLLSGVPYQKGWQICGRIRIIKKSWLLEKMLHSSNGQLKIGAGFKCNNKVTSNSVGLIQPTVINISSEGSCLKIGDNVGISGSTICCSCQVTIGNDVLIGSGCLITDTDAHPLDWIDRKECRGDKTQCAPIHIGNNVFIGARSIILKGVTIGERSVIGAGSVVTQDVPQDVIVAGNPAKVVKSLHLSGKDNNPVIE